MKKKILLTLSFVLFIGLTLNNLQAYNNSNKISNDCCITGEACCDTKEACFEDTQKLNAQGNQTNQNNECCGQGNECCEIKASCCNEENMKSGSSQGSISSINSDDKDCCKDGDKKCCDKDKSCCTDKNNSGNSQGEMSDSAICPVSGEKFVKGSGEKFTYLGTDYEFCCGGCVNEFKTGSIKYTDGKAICPICNHDDGIASLTSVHENTTYYFCNENCKEKFEKDPNEVLNEYKSGKKQKDNHNH
ncbi:MAG TPA: hypothetical protein PLG90_00830 [Ignavibacteria bacterium]|nr:hypothetical protein [Ignavibacteria bacterium]